MVTLNLFQDIWISVIAIYKCLLFVLFYPVEEFLNLNMHINCSKLLIANMVTEQWTMEGKKEW